MSKEGTKEERLRRLWRDYEKYGDSFQDIEGKQTMDPFLADFVFEMFAPEPNSKNPLDQLLLKARKKLRL